MAGGCIRDDDPDNVGVAPGDKLPEFSVTISDGTVCGSQTLSGRWGVIEFFNTGCGDCRESFPVLQEVSEYYQDNPKVEVIAIAREENSEDIETYWSENNLTIPWSAQPDRKVYNLFATVGIPRLYISNPDGVIAAAYGPENPPTATQIISVIGEP